MTRPTSTASHSLRSLISVSASISAVAAQYPETPLYRATPTPRKVLTAGREVRRGKATDLAVDG
jgi:hypothetical protein